MHDWYTRAIVQSHYNLHSKYRLCVGAPTTSPQTLPLLTNVANRFEVETPRRSLVLVFVSAQQSSPFAPLSPPPLVAFLISQVRGRARRTLGSHTGRCIQRPATHEVRRVTVNAIRRRFRLDGHRESDHLLLYRVAYSTSTAVQDAVKCYLELSRSSSFFALRTARRYQRCA